MKIRSRLLLLLLLLAACLLGACVGSAARAEAAPVAVTLRPVEDVSFPFWCDWSYDWEERCWLDDSDRLSVGGDTDKVWRAGLRFSIAGIPAGSTILDASLTLRHDAVCLGPRKTTRPCRARRYTIDLHAIFTPAWFSEREVELGPLLARAALSLATRSDWLSWDLTALVESWLAGEPNNGVLLKLADFEEDTGVGGPALPSSTFALAAARPALDVVYLPPEA